MSWGSSAWDKAKGSVGAKVFGRGNPILAGAGLGYDLWRNSQGGGGGYGHSPAWSGEGAPTGNQQRALDRYALYTDLGKEGKAAVWANKAARRGITGDLGALADKYGSSEDALTRMATAGGPIGARHAARYESQLGEKYMTDAAAQAKVNAQEQIGYGAANLERDLRALGAQVDPSSPAYQALAARYLQTRQDAATSANRQIDLQLAAAKAAARAGALSPQALIDIGDTVFAMHQLQQEQDRFQQMQRGAMYASFINPLNALGAGVGGLTGGSQGAFAGGPAFNQGFSQLQQLFSMFAGMGGTPGVTAPTGLSQNPGGGGILPVPSAYYA